MLLVLANRRHWVSEGHRKTVGLVRVTRRHWGSIKVTTKHWGQSLQDNEACEGHWKKLELLRVTQKAMGQ